MHSVSGISFSILCYSIFEIYVVFSPIRNFSGEDTPPTQCTILCSCFLFSRLLFDNGLFCLVKNHSLKSRHKSFVFFCVLFSFTVLWCSDGFHVLISGLCRHLNERSPRRLCAVQAIWFSFIFFNLESFLILLSDIQFSPLTNFSWRRYYIDESYRRHNAQPLIFCSIRFFSIRFFDEGFCNYLSKSKLHAPQVE